MVETIVLIVYSTKNSTIFQKKKIKIWAVFYLFNHVTKWPLYELFICLANQFDNINIAIFIKSMLSYERIAYFSKFRINLT